MRARVTGPVRDALLDDVARRVLAVIPGAIARVGIDGIDGAGKTTFADELAERVRARRPVIRASVDRFHNPKAVRYRRGRQSPEGFFRDSYDYGALRAALLDPLSPGGSRTFRRAVFDVEADTPIDSPVEEAPADAALIFDGIFLHRPELLDYWDFSLLLDVRWERNHHVPNSPAGWPSDPAHPLNRRYAEGQALYFEECRPRERATLVVNNEDLAKPFVVRALPLTAWLRR